MAQFGPSRRDEVIRDGRPSSVTSGPVHALSRFATISLVMAALIHPRPAGAETLFLSDDAWQIFTDGRVGAFASWTLGEGLPQLTYRLAPNGATIVQQVTAG